MLELQSTLLCENPNFCKIHLSAETHLISRPVLTSDIELADTAQSSNYFTRP